MSSSAYINYEALEELGIFIPLEERKQQRPPSARNQTGPGLPPRTPRSPEIENKVRTPREATPRSRPTQRAATPSKSPRPSSGKPPSPRLPGGAPSFQPLSAYLAAHPPESAAAADPPPPAPSEPVRRGKRITTNEDFGGSLGDILKPPPPAKPAAAARNQPPPQKQQQPIRAHSAGPPRTPQSPSQRTNNANSNSSQPSQSGNPSGTNCEPVNLVLSDSSSAKQTVGDTGGGGGDNPPRPSSAKSVLSAKKEVDQQRPRSRGMSREKQQQPQQPVLPRSRLKPTIEDFGGSLGDILAKPAPPKQHGSHPAAAGGSHHAEGGGGGGGEHEPPSTSPTNSHHNRQSQSSLTTPPSSQPNDEENSSGGGGHSRDSVSAPTHQPERGMSGMKKDLPKRRASSAAPMRDSVRPATPRGGGGNSVQNKEENHLPTSAPESLMIFPNEASPGAAPKRKPPVLSSQKPKPPPPAVENRPTPSSSPTSTARSASATPENITPPATADHFSHPPVPKKRTEPKQAHQPPPASPRTVAPQSRESVKPHSDHSRPEAEHATPAPRAAAVSQGRRQRASSASAVPRPGSSGAPVLPLKPAIDQNLPDSLSEFMQDSKPKQQQPAPQQQRQVRPIIRSPNRPAGDMSDLERRFEEMMREKEALFGNMGARRASRGAV